jgi:hypothetical protein
MSPHTCTIRVASVLVVPESQPGYQLRCSASVAAHNGPISSSSARPCALELSVTRPGGAEVWHHEPCQPVRLCVRHPAEQAVVGRTRPRHARRAAVNECHGGQGPLVNVGSSPSVAVMKAEPVLVGARADRRNLAFHVRDIGSCLRASERADHVDLFAQTTKAMVHVPADSLAGIDARAAQVTAGGGCLSDCPRQCVQRGGASPLADDRRHGGQVVSARPGSKHQPPKRALRWELPPVTTEFIVHRIDSGGRVGCRPLLPVQKVAEANRELARRLGKIGERSGGMRGA